MYAAHLRHCLPGLLFAGLLILAGCATPPPASDAAALAEFNETNDPLEPSNRVFYEINDGIDTVVMRPLAQGYRAVVPAPVRTGVHNLLTNMGTPVMPSRRASASSASTRSAASPASSRSRVSAMSNPTPASACTARMVSRSPTSRPCSK